MRVNIQCGTKFAWQCVVNNCQEVHRSSHLGIKVLMVWHPHLVWSWTAAVNIGFPRWALWNKGRPTPNNKARLWHLTPHSQGRTEPALCVYVRVGNSASLPAGHGARNAVGVSVECRRLLVVWGAGGGHPHSPSAESHFGSLQERSPATGQWG